MVTFNDKNPKQPHFNLSSQNYLNFINLYNVLITLFENKYLKRNDLINLNITEKTILKSFLIRKKLLPRSKSLPESISFYNKQNLFRARKRKEEKLKYVLFICVNFLKSQFMLRNKISLYEQIKSGKSFMENIDIAFFNSYFGKVCKDKQLDISVFYLPRLTGKYGENDNRYRTISKVYIRLLRRSKSFLNDLGRMVNDQFEDSNGNLVGIRSIWKSKLEEKLKNKITVWNNKIKEEGAKVGIRTICQNIEENKRFVMPWSMFDLENAIKQVNDSFNLGFR